MPRPPSLAHLRARLAEAEKQAEKWAAYAQMYRAAVAELERLHSGTKTGTRSGHMDQGVSEPARKRPRGKPLTSDGPVARAAKALGIPMQEIARRLGQKPGTVKKWNARGNIPDEHRAAFERVTKSA